jgi:hypothetical protein
MSVWFTTSVIDAKQYDHSGCDPRKKAERASIQLAMVPEYVYHEKGDEGRVLPYLRLSLFAKSSDVILTEHQARELIEELEYFVMRGKWRGKPRREYSTNNTEENHD